MNSQSNKDSIIQYNNAFSVFNGGKWSFQSNHYVLQRGREKEGKEPKEDKKKKYKLLVGDFFKKIWFLIYGVHYSGGKTNSVIIDYIRAALKAT